MEEPEKPKPRDVHQSIQSKPAPSPANMQQVTETLWEKNPLCNHLQMNGQSWLLQDYSNMRNLLTNYIVSATDVEI